MSGFFLKIDLKESHWNVMIGGDGFLGREILFALKSHPKSGFVYIIISEQLSSHFPSHCKSSRCHSSWQTRTKASRSTFPLSSCLPDSQGHQCCHSCHTVTHAHICSMIHGKERQNNCRIWPNISLKKGGSASKTSTLQQGLGLGKILWCCRFGGDLSCGLGSNHNIAKHLWCCDQQGVVTGVTV